LPDDALGAGVQRLAELVDYQDAGVVSRPVLKKGKGSVILFAFDRDQGLSEHTVPHDALVHVLEGEAEITVAGESHLVGPGEMIVMPANKPHAVHAPDRFKMVLVMLRE
jgi:quercetin dioxygenase-like cupin family protein